MRRQYEERKILKIKHPGMRFPNYFTVGEEESDKWVESVKRLVSQCLTCLKTIHKPNSNKVCLKEYSAAFQNINKLLPNSGILKTNHMMGVMAVIGILPLWYYEYFHGLQKTKAIKMLTEEHALPKTK